MGKAIQVSVLIWMLWFSFNEASTELRFVAKTGEEKNPILALNPYASGSDSPAIAAQAPSTLTAMPLPSLPGSWSLPTTGLVTNLLALPGGGLAANTAVPWSGHPGPLIHVWANASEVQSGGYPTLTLNGQGPPREPPLVLLGVTEMLLLSNGVLVAGGTTTSGAGLALWQAPTTDPFRNSLLPGTGGRDYVFDIMITLPNGTLVVHCSRQGGTFYDFYDNFTGTTVGGVELSTSAAGVGLNRVTMMLLLTDGSLVSMGWAVNGEGSQLQWWPSAMALRGGAPPSSLLSLPDVRDVAYGNRASISLPSGGLALCADGSTSLYVWPNSTTLQNSASPLVLTLEAKCYSLLLLPDGSVAAGLGFAGNFAGPALLKLWPSLSALISNQGVVYQLPGLPASTAINALASLPGGLLACGTSSALDGIGSVVLISTTATTTATGTTTATATTTATTTTATATAALVPSTAANGGSAALPWTLFVITLVLLLVVSGVLAWTQLAAKPAAQAQDGLELASAA